MPVNPEACVVPSSITGCENRLRSQNPCQEAVMLALGRWRGALSGPQGRSKATGPELDKTFPRALASSISLGTFIFILSSLKK